MSAHIVVVILDVDRPEIANVDRAADRCQGTVTSDRDDVPPNPMSVTALLLPSMVT